MTSDQQPTPSVEEARRAFWMHIYGGVNFTENEHGKAAMDTLVAAIRAPLAVRIEEWEAYVRTDNEIHLYMNTERDTYKRRAEAAEKVAVEARYAISLAAPGEFPTLRAALAEYDAWPA